MPVCARCNKEVGLLGLLNFNKQTGRCGKCQGEVAKALNHFRQTFIAFCQDAMLSPREWTELQNLAYQSALDWQEALAFVRADALNYLERVLTFAAADNVITDEEETYILNWRMALGLSEDIARPLLDRLAYLKYLTNIRRGALPTVTPSIHLESDECCHLEMDAVYYKVNAKSITHVPGRFVATNKKLHFLSQSGGTEIPRKRIMRIERDGRGVYLELST